MNPYGSFCEDFYINMNLSTEMELPNSRDTVLHFFERIQKKYPAMRNFYSRDKGDFVLEQDKDDKQDAQWRWVSIEPRRICSTHVNPEEFDEALAQHELVLELAPYMLTVSPLDCEALDLLFGFDFTYQGNHNELVSDVLGVSPALDRLAEYPGSKVINLEPSLTLALDDECRTQCRVSIENRTSLYHVRTGDYPEDQLSVYVSARHAGSLDTGESYQETLKRLLSVCRELVEDYVADHVLRPLQERIPLK